MPSTSLRKFVLLWLLLLLAVIIHGGKGFPQAEHMAGLIASMKYKFQARRVHIMFGLFDSLMNARKMGAIVQLWKHLSSLGTPSMCSWADHFNSIRRNVMTGTSRSMHVFMITPRFLETVLRDINNSSHWRFTTLMPDASYIIAERNPLWLVWLEGSSMKFLSGLHIPLNCHFYVTHYADESRRLILVFEVYRISPVLPLKIELCGNYSSGKLEWTTVPFFERRRDLQGINLTAFTMHNPPNTFGALVDNTVVVNGKFGDFMRVLESYFNFTTILQKVWVPNQWVAIEMLWKETSDFGAVDLSLSVDKFISFTPPLFISRYYVYIRQLVDERLDWLNFLTPFTIGLWTSYFFLLLLLAVIAAVCSPVSFRDALPQCLFDVTEMATMQGTEDTPTRYSVRVVYLSAGLLAMVIMGAYSANIIAHLTVKHEEMPFNDLRGLLGHGRYNFGVAFGSLEEFVAIFSSDVTFQEMYSKSRQTRNRYDGRDLSLTIRQGLERVCNSSYAFLARHDQVLANSAGLSCRPIALPKFFMTANVGIFTRRDLPYIDFISHFMTKMRVNGMLSHIFRSSMVVSKLETADPSVPEVELKNIGPFAALLLMTMLSSAIMLIVETVRSRSRTQK